MMVITNAKKAVNVCMKKNECLNLWIYSALPFCWYYSLINMYVGLVS